MEPQSKPGLESLHQLLFSGCLHTSCKSFLTFKKSIMKGQEAKKFVQKDQYFFQFEAEGAPGLCVYVFQLEIMML